MNTVYAIYKSYIKENKKVLLISLILSLRFEIITSCITFFGFVLIENEVHSRVFNLIGYLLINSILPIIVSIVNLNKAIPYIRNCC